MIAWGLTGSYMRPVASEDGMYQVVLRVGGRSGPVYRAQFIAGLGIAGDLGEARDLLDDAKLDAQAHRDELDRQNAAAAKAPV